MSKSGRGCKERRMQARRGKFRRGLSVREYVRKYMQGREGEVWNKRSLARSGGRAWVR